MSASTTPTDPDRGRKRTLAANPLVTVTLTHEPSGARPEETTAAIIAVLIQSRTGGS